MIAVFFRLIIILTGLVFISAFSALAHSALVATLFFLCVWISVRGFYDNFYWIVGFALMYSMIHYDAFAVYFLVIIIVTYLFDLVREQIMKSRYNVKLACFFTALFVVISVSFFVNLVYGSLSSIVVIQLLVISAISCVFFFPLYIAIERIERIINIHARGLDLKSHI